MGRFRGLVPGFVFLFLFVLSIGCGGGGVESAASLSPPPAPDFSLAFSPASVSVGQGGTAAAAISIASLNGFTGVVQVSLTGLPSSVTSNPSGSFAVTPLSPITIVFGAVPNASLGSFQVTAQSTSGSLSHSTQLSLSVIAGQLTSLHRTSYVRTGAVASFDNPPSEPLRRLIAYDPARKRIFVANRAMNRIDVLSSADESRVAQISVPAVSSVDLSSDGATAWAGSLAQHVYAIDSSTLQVKAVYSIPGLQPIPNTLYDRPEELADLSNGKFFVRLRQSASPQSLLALWDPAAGTLANLTSSAPQLFQSGLGPLARSGDRTKVLVAANDASGAAALYNVNGNVLVGPVAVATGSFSFAAANADASRSAVVVSNGSTPQLLLLDSSLGVVGTHSASAFYGLTFSSDGKFLYASEQSSSATPVIAILDGRDAHFVGQVPDPIVQNGHSEVQAADESNLLFARANRGVAFIDASVPGTLPVAVPAFSPAPALQPSQGSIAGGTSVALSGQNFESASAVRFGSQSAASVAVNGSTQIRAISPASVASGAVNVSAYFPSGWLALAPDAFSYGPQILEVLPNAGSKSGGEAVQIYGYGFGADASSISAKFAAAQATVQNVEDVSSIASSLGFDANYPFPLQRITVQSPPGPPGAADITVTTPSGSATLPNAFQYVQSVQTFPRAAAYKFLLYDQPRQLLYLSAVDHVDTFDLRAAAYGPPLYPPGGPPSNSGLRGLALTPDGSQLVVADFGAQSLYLIPPDAPSQATKIPVGGLVGFLNSGPAQVAATSANSIFIAMSGEGGGSASCSSCLSQLDLSAAPPVLQPAPQPQISMLAGSPLLSSTSTGNQVFLAYANQPSSPVGVWVSTSPNQFTVAPAASAAVDLAASPDGSSLAVRTTAGIELRSASDLSITALPAAPEIERIPSRAQVLGMAMHPSGALLYLPFLTGSPPATVASGNATLRGGVDILDAHSGRLRLRIYLPEPFSMLSSDVDALHGDFLAIDETGQRLFALTTSGLAILQLASAPLGIGWLSVTSGSASGGAVVTLRGSGFQSGTRVTLGGKSATSTYIDPNTLAFTVPLLSPGTQQLVVTNPDGEASSLDAAFMAR